MITKLCTACCSLSSGGCAFPILRACRLLYHHLCLMIIPQFRGVVKPMISQNRNQLPVGTGCAVSAKKQDCFLYAHTILKMTFVPCSAVLLGQKRIGHGTPCPYMMCRTFCQRYHFPDSRFHSIRQPTKRGVQNGTPSNPTERRCFYDFVQCASGLRLHDHLME